MKRLLRCSFELTLEVEMEDCGREYYVIIADKARVVIRG